jgi:hypothetical protein
MAEITEQQSQQALEMVKQYFRSYLEAGYPEPELIMDWDWSGKPEPTIVWEEGPYEWTMIYTGNYNRFPEGVWGEPYTGWALSLFSSDVDYSKSGDDNASGAEHDPELKYLYEEAMKEFGDKNSSADIELFTNFTPTFEKDSGGKSWNNMMWKDLINIQNDNSYDEFDSAWDETMEHFERNPVQEGQSVPRVYRNEEEQRQSLINSIAENLIYEESHGSDEDFEYPWAVWEIFDDYVEEYGHQPNITEEEVNSAVARLKNK